jgi:hypothetical protein
MDTSLLASVELTSHFPKTRFNFSNEFRVVIFSLKYSIAFPLALLHLLLAQVKCGGTPTLSLDSILNVIVHAGAIRVLELMLRGRWHKPAGMRDGSIFFYDFERNFAILKTSVGIYVRVITFFEDTFSDCDCLLADVSQTPLAHGDGSVAGSRNDISRRVDENALLIEVFVRDLSFRSPHCTCSDIV